RFLSGQFKVRRLYIKTAPPVNRKSRQNIFPLPGTFFPPVPSNVTKGSFPLLPRHICPYPGILWNCRDSPRSCPISILHLCYRFVTDLPPSRNASERTVTPSKCYTDFSNKTRGPAPAL